MPPASTIGPSKNCRTARTNANGLSQPVCPPAPAVSSTRPSAPAATARSAWRMLATSASTSAPASCSGSTTGAGEPTLVMTISGLWRSSDLRDPRRAAHWSDARSGSGRAARGCAGLVLVTRSRRAISPSQASSSSVVPAIHRRKRADHAVAAGGDDELDAGDEKHRRRDQRQAAADRESAKAVSGGARRVRPGLSRRGAVLAFGATGRSHADADERRHRSRGPGTSQ